MDFVEYIKAGGNVRTLKYELGDIYINEDATDIGNIKAFLIKDGKRFISSKNSWNRDGTFTGFEDTLEFEHRLIASYASHKVPLAKFLHRIGRDDLVAKLR